MARIIEEQATINNISKPIVIIPRTMPIVAIFVPVSLHRKESMVFLLIIPRMTARIPHIKPRNILPLIKVAIILIMPKATEEIA